METLPIIAVDDSATSLALIVHMVEGIGQPVKTFNNPLKALEFAEGHELALAIVDFEMPGMDGVEMTQRLRQMRGHADLPIIMITGTVDTQVRYRALHAGVTEFLRKPFEKIELSLRLRNILALRKSQQDAKAHTQRLKAAVEEVSERLTRRERETIFRLSKAAEFRDTDTGLHIVRMATYSKIIAQHVVLDAQAVQMIHNAAPMHDIGKIAISDSILRKTGPLTPEERKIMETHTTHGYSILKDSDCDLLRLGAEIALNHHERWDGGGYPRGLAGSAIPIAARIASVADVFDALTTERPYKRAWSAGEARDHIVKEAGKQFDPDCVAAFLAGWGEILQVMEETRFEAEGTEPAKAAEAASASRLSA